MTNFFFIGHPGHGGGGWLQLCINQHPAGMSCVAECNHETCLDFERRGLDMRHYDEEVLKLLEDRVYYGDVAIGIIKSFRPAFIKWAHENGAVRQCQLVYNPRWRFTGKWTSKVKPASVWFKAKYGREMETREEQCEATAAYFAQNYFSKYLARAKDWPIIRLEDLNRSMKLRSGYFKRFMEWLTGTEWDDEYISHIRENWTPAYQYHNWVEWEGPGKYEGRIAKIVTVQRGTPTWHRDNWEPDPYVVKYWDNLTAWQRALYHKYTDEIDERLGYNNGNDTCAHDDWEFRGAMWGEVGE